MKSYFQITGFSVLVLSFSMLSCRNHESESSASERTAVVKIHLSETTFQDTDQRDAQASSKNLNSTGTTIIQRSSVTFDDYFTLDAELSPVPSLPEKSYQASTKTSAQVEQGTLPNDVKYKLIVYDASGTYVTERDYTRGQETNAEELKLNAGNNYTFIAYSIGSTSDLPAVTYADASNKTLSTSSLKNVDGNTDLMYFKKEILLDNGENNLDIILKHQFSEITTTFSSASTGYNTTELNAGFTSHYSSSDFNLSDGNITRNGTEGLAGVTFTGLNSMNLSAPGRLINGSTLTGAFNISRITIGTITRTNISLFNNLKIIPGVKYNLNISITPNDIELTYQGVPAVRINGKIWMRHNLGVNTSLDPDTTPTNSNLGGNYYQFGRSAVVATSTTGAGAISGWNTNAAPLGSWNSGTETAPVKTSTDPCPSGWRVPSRGEAQQLVNDTQQTAVGGSWSTSGTQNRWGPAKVYTSRRNIHVKLTFPAAGYRNSPDGILYWRGGAGYNWTSSVTSNEVPRLFNSETQSGISTSQDSNFSRTTGFAIRCIAE